MISYKVKGIILAVIISLASIMMPFSVYAENIDSHIRGRNYTYEPITYSEIQLTQNTYYQNIGVFHITFELDDEYIGYVLPNYNIQYDNYFYGASTPNWGTLSKTFNRRVFVNGSSFSFDVPVVWNSISINSAHSGIDPFYYDSFSITSSDVTKFADINSLDQIINILQDLYNSNDQIEGLLNDQLTQLQLVVSNTSLANTYLETLTKLRQFNFPIESFSSVLMTYNYNNTILDLFQNGYWSYPVFSIPSGNTIIHRFFRPSYGNLIFIFACNFNPNTNQIVNYFNIQNANIVSSTIISEAIGYKIGKLVLSYNGNSEGYIDITALRSFRLIPIYLQLDDYNMISTDFALQYGLNNNLLDNIQKIANGTNQSNSAASDLEQEASEYSDIADDVIGVEEGLTSNFETSVNQIDLNTGLNGFAGNFMTSATWVRTQFDRLTENTPYGSLVVYGLTLGFVLLMLGKVLL